MSVLELLLSVRYTVVKIVEYVINSLSMSIMTSTLAVIRVYHRLQVQNSVSAMVP